MKITINQMSFIPIKGIGQIKASKENLNEYILKDSNIEGTVTFNINYYNNMMEESFTSETISYRILVMDEIANPVLSLENISMEVIDNNGINVFYDLIIDYKEENINVPKENDDKIKNIKENEELVNDLKKEELMEDYDHKLSESLDDSIEIISTKSTLDERGFIDLFNNTVFAYKVLKKIFVPDESALNDISKKYNISLEELYKKYDRENKCIFINE